MNEPILKDEEEVFPFLNDEKKKNKVDIPLIVTIIVSILVVAFVGKSCYAFYIGFRYYDIAHPNTTLVD